MRILACGSMDAREAALIERLRHASTVSIVDVSGHERYAPSIAAAAPTANLALVLVEARHGLAREARHQTFLVSLFGIRRVVLAVHGMDTVAHSREIFDSIERDYREFCTRLDVTDLTCVPVSGADAGNVVAPSPAMSWYVGPTIAACLDAGPPAEDRPRPETAPHVSDQFRATVLWMHEHPLMPGRSYLVRIGAQTAPATVAPLKYKVNVDTLAHEDARQLELNEVGVCDLEVSRPVVFEPFAVDRELGSFTLIDRLTNETVGAGLLHGALGRSEDVRWQPFDVNKKARAALKGQKPCVLWFTGLSAAGKSTITNLVETRLHALGHHTYVLDGDNVRHGLNKDLGFTEADRVENIRRVAEVSRLFVDAGLIVLVAFISPFRAERRMARELFEPGEFFEVFVDAPLDVAEARDPKGLYRKARRGELRNFTGIDSPYERPEHAELHLDTTKLSAVEAAEIVVRHMRAAGVIR